MKISDMPKCIYCKKYKKTAEFYNREHVIPQAFGKFTPNNLILNQKNLHRNFVCNNCNNNFSKFERWFSKDSYEGYILRNKYRKKVESPQRRRVKVIIKEGEYTGLYVELASTDTISVMPQIGMRRKDGNWDYFLADDIESIRAIKKELYSLDQNSLRAFCLDEDAVVTTFRLIGIKFEKKGILSPPSSNDILCEVSSIVDKTIHRAVAKIAFNFFACFNYKYIVLDKSFDKIREFILTGNSKASISIDNEPILFDEKKSMLGRLGHIVTINKNYYGNIISQVSLFNHLRYTVLLADNFVHKNMKVGFGRFFDISSKKVLEIGKSSLLIPTTRIIIPQRKLWLP